MGRIYAMHGVVEGATPEKFSHRNLLDRAEFDRFLRSRSEPFVPLDDALAGRGDALTIDDATRASADAARLARQAGHEVALFVNPFNVATGRPHQFLCLNVLLDDAVQAAPIAPEQRLDLSTPAARMLFRRDVKEQLRRCREDGEQEAVVATICARLGMVSVHLPDYLATLSTVELLALHRQGVHVGNHGWMHVDPAALDDDGVDGLIARGREWLESTLNVPVSTFAVPFGETRLPPQPRGTSADVWLLLHDALAEGPLGAGIYNRVNLTL